MAGYARLSNDFWQDKDILKLRRRNPSAALLYVMAISWCSDHSSDGLIAEDELLYVLNASDEDVNDLVVSGLLLEPSESTKGKYAIRNYLKYQNSAKQIEEAKEKGKEKKRRQRGTKQDKSSVPDVSPNVTENVPDMSLGDKSSVPDVSFNQEPITNNQKNSSNEEFSLPQTPSQAEGAGEEDSWREDNLKANLGEEPRAISYEQAKAIVEQVRGFYPASKMRGRSYERTLVLESAPIVKAAGAAPDIVAWFVNRCREYVARQSEPRYVTDFGIYVAGGGKADKRPYWEVDWANEPMPKSPEEEKAEAEHERRLRDVDWLCSHVDDEECQRAALALSEKQQALARSKWPDEWYRLWRRAENLRDREERERMEAGA
ncbi:hypothetical protein ABG913_07325 [Bifidobacterium longum]